jgi:hypothetical protein
LVLPLSGDTRANIAVENQHKTKLNVGYIPVKTTAKPTKLNVGYIPVKTTIKPNIQV